MAHNDEPATEKGATKAQIRALSIRTNMDISGLSLTFDQARALLDEVEAGREPVVRNVFVKLNCPPLGELLGIDEATVSHKLGVDVIYLPRDVRVPQHEKLIAKQLPDGSTVRLPDGSVVELPNGSIVIMADRKSGRNCGSGRDA